MKPHFQASLLLYDTENESAKIYIMPCHESSGSDRQSHESNRQTSVHIIE